MEKPTLKRIFRPFLKNRSLIAYRKRDGLTQEEVAKKINISVVAYRNLELCKVMARIDIAISLAKLFRTTPNELFEGAIYETKKHKEKLAKLKPKKKKRRRKLKRLTWVYNVYVRRKVLEKEVLVDVPEDEIGLIWDEED